MKKLIIVAVLIVFSLSVNTDANTNYSKRVGGYFYTSLSHYGTWIEIGFGTPVWRPTNMRRNWSPYYQGQWIYTDYGWYWDSYEPFGDIVYHYGRWYYDDFYGWIWYPDDEWAPAWVDWRYNDDYIGWAPLSPYASFSISLGIRYTYNYHVPYQYWNFVNYNRFCDQNIYKYYVAPKYRYRVFEQTKVRTNYSYYNGRVRNDGVDFDRIRNRSGRSIEKRNIVTVNDPNELSRDRKSKTRDRELRTYIANREDLSRDGLRDLKVERNDRKSSLDISKVEIGRDRNLNRSNERNDKSDVITRDRNNNTNTEKRQIDEKVQGDVNREKVNQRNNDQIKRSEEIKRNEQINNQRKSNEEAKKRNDVNVQKRAQDNSKVLEKKSEPIIDKRNQNYNTSRNRSTDLKRTETKARTEKKDDKRKVNENNTRTR
jgi:hypothetical protein